jgi:heat shock protein HslJ
MLRRNLVISSIAAGALILALAAIVLRANAQPATTPAPATKWTLTYLAVNGQPYSLVPHRAVTLTLQPTTHTINGDTGCNAYQAIYHLNGTRMHFENFAMTAVACLNPVGAQESVYLRALTTTDTLNITGNVLTITASGGSDILRFAAAQG